MAESESGWIWHRKINSKKKNFPTDGIFCWKVFLYFINAAWIYARIWAQK